MASPNSRRHKRFNVIFFETLSSLHTFHFLHATFLHETRPPLLISHVTHVCCCIFLSHRLTTSHLFSSDVLHPEPQRPAGPAARVARTSHLYGGPHAGQTRITNALYAPVTHAGVRRFLHLSFICRLFLSITRDGAH